MNKKIMAFAAAFTILASCAGCSGKKDSSSDAPAPTAQTENTTNPSDTNDTATTVEPTTEEVTEHISPVESLSSTLGSQVTVDKIIQRTEGSNNVQLPLADFIEEGDVVSSFTFVIYSASIYQPEAMCFSATGGETLKASALTALSAHTQEQKKFRLTEPFRRMSEKAVVTKKIQIP